METNDLYNIVKNSTRDDISKLESKIVGVEEPNIEDLEKYVALAVYWGSSLDSIPGRMAMSQKEWKELIGKNRSIFDAYYQGATLAIAAQEDKISYSTEDVGSMSSRLTEVLTRQLNSMKAELKNTTNAYSNGALGEDGSISTGAGDLDDLDDLDGL